MKKAILFLLVAAAAHGQFTNAHSIWGRPISSAAPTNGALLVWNFSTAKWEPSGGVATRIFTYAGVCQAGVASFPDSQPSSNAPTSTCVNSGTAITAVQQWSNNTSNQTVQGQFTVPSGYAGNPVSVSIA